MTSGLLKSSMTCTKLYKRCLGKNVNDPKYIEHKEYRNRYNSLKRITKKKYYTEQINIYRNDSSKLWKVMKELIGKKSDKSSLSDVFIINGEPVTDKKLISQGFCNFFTNVGRNLAGKIPKPNKPYHEYLTSNQLSSFFMHPTDPNEVNKTIRSMKPKNSSGHDNLNGKLIKLISKEICILLLA